MPKAKVKATVTMKAIDALRDESWNPEKTCFPLLLALPGFVRENKKFSKELGTRDEFRFWESMLILQTWRK